MHPNRFAAIKLINRIGLRICINGRIIKHAQDEAELEKKHAMDDVKQEIIAVAALMAQKVVAASINTDIQDTLVEETLKEMGESTWQS